MMKTDIKLTGISMKIAQFLMGKKLSHKDQVRVLAATLKSYLQEKPELKQEVLDTLLGKEDTFILIENKSSQNGQKRSERYNIE